MYFWWIWGRGTGRENYATVWSMTLRNINYAITQTGVLRKKKRLKCSKTQEYAKKFFRQFCKGIMKTILKYFSFTTRYFLLQNHPFQAYLVQKYIHFYMLRALADMSAKNVSVFYDSPNYVYNCRWQNWQYKYMLIGQDI